MIVAQLTPRASHPQLRERLETEIPQRDEGTIFSWWDVAQRADFHDNDARDGAD